MPHAAAGEPQTGGSPMQLPLAHSKPARQPVPSASGAEVHTRRPVASAAHVPWQQSAVTEHTVPAARHCPGPGSQR